MNSYTRTLLVLLRLAIGWHFLFEGLEKIQSLGLGATETNRPWSSEAYLREAPGPLGGLFHHIIPDADDVALEKLSPIPLATDASPVRVLPAARLPHVLVQEWDAYLADFAKHYELDAAARSEAEKKLAEEKNKTALWLLEGRKSVKHTFPSGTVNVEATTPARVEEYRLKVANVRRMLSEDLPAFGRDVWKERLRAAKAEVAQLRSGLLSDLAEHTAEMKKALRDVLSAKQRELAPMTEPSRTQPIDVINFAVRWGLTVVGICLLLGICSRSASLAAAGFLLSIYLLYPPFPWVPENLRAEGHYLFVDKNLIEMLAAFTLAGVPTGRWAGLDGVLAFLNPRRWGRPNREG